jgi:AraC family transcriptional activator of pobA
MINVQYKRNKYGKELLLDCISFADIVATGVDISKPHVVNFYEIFIVFSGQGQVLFDGNSIRLQDNCVLLFPPGKPKTLHLEQSLEGNILIFEGEFLETFLKDSLFLHRIHLFNDSSNQPSLLLDRQKMAILKDITTQIRREIQLPHPDSEHLLRAYLYQLLILLNREYTRQFGLDAALYTHTQAIQFKQLLQVHIQQKQTVNEYASLLHINRNRLNQLCKTIFGLEAKTIIKSHLINACKSELLLSNKTVSEISFLFNFSASSNFVRFFKSHTGYSPQEYRQQHAK